MFASREDIQAWLQPDKFTVDDANSSKSNLDATRIIKGQLAGFFTPAVIQSWVDPDSTPDLIRSIAGRLTAAFMHARVYSEESDREISAYSQWLYDGAMALLTQILTGTLTVTDSNDDPVTTTGGGVLTFYPDDTAPGPYFTMDKIYS